MLYLTFDLALALECEASFRLENIEDIHVKGENNELILSPIWKCVCLWSSFILHNYSTENFLKREINRVSRIISDFFSNP